MPEGFHTLTEKEKETLRLLVRGYDAKSIARHFELSVHTVNERLRNARQKMSVSSSREAARVLFDKEETDPDFLADRLLGEANTGSGAVSITPPNDGHGIRIPLAMLIGGGFIMSLILAALVLSPISQNTGSAKDAAPAAPVAGVSSSSAAETEAVQSARQWLALVDDHNWKASWEAAGQSFKELNTAETWASVAGEVQPPLGAVRSRAMKSQESVPAPPSGYEMVKFSTSFKNKPDATETLSLVREHNAWKVVGYWIE